MSKRLLCLTLFAMVSMAGPAGADSLSGLADVTVVDGAIASLRHEGTEYVVADGDLVLGTTTRWYIDAGVETLWVEGDPAPADTVSGTSNAKDGDVGSKADNFLFTLDGGTNISSIDGVDFQETIFASLTDTIFVFERNGNDNGTVQAILEDGSLGIAMTLTSNAEPYASTGVAEGNQTAYGYVVKTDVPVQGVRITASGHDTLSISTPKGAEPAPPGLSVTIPVPNAGFEDPVLAEDDYTWGDVPDWTLVGGEATGIEGSGVWSVTLADFDPVLAPEGENVLFTEYLPEGIAKGVAQVLTETFAADTDYTLTAEVGNSNYYYFAGYSVQLLAGGTVIAEDNDTLWPEYKTWATSTVAYTYDPADSGLVGQPLEIRLLNLELDKDSPPAGEVVGVEFDNVTLSYVAGAEPGVTIPVDPNSDLAAANALANPGDTILFAEGTYDITSQIEIKDGVTYQGAGAGLTIIDGNDVTRAFVAYGDRSATNGQVDANGVSVPNATGPTGWVLDGLTIQNCVSDAVGRQDILGAARDLLNNYAGAPYTVATAQAENGGITDNPGWFDALSGGADDDLTDVELQAYLDANPVGSAGHLVVNDDKSDDGGAITIHDQAAGTIANCEFLNNHTPLDGDDGGAINIAGLSVVTINDCLFDGNYAVSPDAVTLDGPSGHGGHIFMQGGSASAITPGTTLIANRCVFLNGRAEDDGGVMRTSGVGSIVRFDACWFEGNTAADDGTVLFIGNESSSELTVTNCVFANNISAGGSDRMCQVRRNSKFINCTFVGNSQDDQDMIYNNANSADTDADGADDESADATQVVNCIFLNNVAGNGDDVLGSRNADFTIAATNCLFFGNTLQSGDPADNTQRPADEIGSILDDPLLDINHHQLAGSPAIDAGVDPATVGVTITTDLNGNPRPEGAAYDIGAYEFAIMAILGL